MRAQRIAGAAAGWGVAWTDVKEHGMEIEGRTVIVTGAGSGIGRALALEFARNGANVICTARRRARIEETVTMIEAEGGIGLAVPADITQRVQVQAMVKATLDRFGQIDVLFNNAGSFQSIAGVHEADPDPWWHDVTVNLLGGFLCIREVLPHMMERDEGIIISMDGGKPVGGTSYACGKAGLMELTRILVLELEMQESHVILFRAGPGLVHTEMTELQANTEAGRRWIPSTKAKIAAGGCRKPEEIALATMEAVRLASLEKSGQSYHPGTDFSAW